MRLIEAMESSADLFSRAQAVIPGGVNSPVRAFRSVGGSPFFTAQADGAHLVTADGKRLIDFVCTWGPAIHGHNHPVLRSALAEALEQGTSFGTPGPREVDMAEKLRDMVPSVEKVRMVNSGTEATMSAIRLARGYTGRPTIIKFAGCYHGHVDALLVKAGSGALTLGQPDSAGIPHGTTSDTRVLNYNDLAGVQQVFAEEGAQIAAIIVEPYPANCGLILPDEGFLEGVRSLCTRHGTVLIFDEVMTGFRLARGGVQEVTGITPDMTAMGKIIGGGLPVGAFGGRGEIMDQLAPLGPVYQAGTLSGNPLAMAAGLASLDLLDETKPFTRLDRVGRHLADALLETAQRKGLPLQVPQTGSMFALFFADEKVRTFEQATSSQSDLFKQVFHYALEHGVYLPPSPFETCFISTAHDEATMDHATEVLVAALNNL